MSRDGGLDLSPKIMGDGATEGEVERANRHGIVVQLPKGCLARLHRTNTRNHLENGRLAPRLVSTASCEEPDPVVILLHTVLYCTCNMPWQR